MAKLDKETVEQLIKLSRIACSETEKEAILSDLKRILEYVEQLHEVDTEHATPCHHVLQDMVNVMRDDETGPTMPREVFLANAPAQIGGMIRVPPVIKNNS